MEHYFEIKSATNDILDEPVVDIILTLCQQQFDQTFLLDIYNSYSLKLLLCIKYQAFIKFTKYILNKA